MNTCRYAVATVAALGFAAVVSLCISLRRDRITAEPGGHHVDAVSVLGEGASNRGSTAVDPASSGHPGLPPLYENGGLVDGMSILIRETDPQRRARHLTQMIGSMRPEDLPLALSLLENRLSAGPSRDEWIVLLYGWAGFDPHAAASYARDRLDGVTRLDVARAVLGRWTIESPRMALAYLDGLVTHPGADYLLYAVTYNLALYHPMLGMEWAALHPSEYRDLLVHHLTVNWLQSDPETALEYIRRNAAQLNLEPAIEEAVRYLARRNLRQALAWVEGLENPVHRHLGRMILVDWWTDAAPRILSDWLITAPPGPEFDPIFARFAVMIAPEFPDAAEEWAAVIADDELRRATLEKLGALTEVGHAVRTAP